MGKSLRQEFRDFIGSMVSFPQDFMGGFFGFAPSESGAEVNEMSAMSIAPFVGAIRMVSGAISTLPFRVWETLPDGSERIAPEHLLDDVLNNQPNPETTAADFWQTVMVHIFLTGNAYAEKSYNGAGQPAALYLRSPFRTFPYRRQDGALAYKTTDTPGGRERWILAEDMCHFRGMGLDSLVGLSPVKYLAREVLGNDLAAQSYSAKFFANDSRPGGYMKAANFLSPEKKKAAIESWIGAHSRGNAHAMALLDGGLEWQKVGVNPDEAQFILTRRLNREQISAITGVPVHFLGETVESRANMEQRSLEFLTYTLKPWNVKLEQVVNIRLFPKLGRGAGRFHARLDTTMFERATYADLLKGIQMGRFSGLMTVDEGRHLLGEQPYSDAQLKSKKPGDKLWQPVNMVVVTEESLTGNLPTQVTDDLDKPNDGGGQGGDDQSGGDGGGKTKGKTGQGGKRSDQEIKRYFRLFYPTFRDALGRISARKKVNEGDFQKALGPVLTQIASAFSFRADAEGENPALSLTTTEFVREYIGSLARRLKLNGNVDVVASEELKRSLRLLRDQCAPMFEEIADDDDRDDDRNDDLDERQRPIEVHVNPEIHITAPVQVQPMEVRMNIDLPRPQQRKVTAVRNADGSMEATVAEINTVQVQTSRDSVSSIRISEETNGS
jgi:HK97 family phage portal protein